MFVLYTDPHVWVSAWDARAGRPPWAIFEPMTSDMPVCVMSGNACAITFYEGAGFTATGERATSSAGDLPELRYDRLLDPMTV